MRKKNEKICELYYFSKQLKEKMKGLGNYPLTVVEAPSGFGKTTAVKEYLKEVSGATSLSCWYTCIGESPLKTWNGICELFEEIDKAAATNLKNLGLPTLEILTDFVLILRKLRCLSETFLIIDNYQLFNIEIQRQLINAFSVHGNNRLHIIFITQPLISKIEDTVHYANIYNIDIRDLMFDKEGIKNYFRMTGLVLSENEIENLLTNTEGWVAAIRLQLLNYQQKGIFEQTSDIDHLIGIAVWNKLSDEERDFLLSICVLDCFSMKQAEMIATDEAYSDLFSDLIENNSFIRYFPDKDLYYMHSILQNYLRNRFYNKPEKFQKHVLNKSGDACAAAAQYYPAARFYYRVSNFDAILSLPFSTVYFNNQKEKDILEFIADLARTCPEEILCKYPLSVIGFAFQLYMDGCYEPFTRLSQLINSVIDNPKGISIEQLHRIKGEFALLTSFNSYNDIIKMSEGHKEAMRYLDSPSNFLLPTSPWTFMNISVVSMFWSKSGHLKNELDYMDTCMPYYLKLSSGHGTGANYVMRAEAMLLRGADEDAEALCYTALYVGTKHQQTALCLCAEFILARIAILRGNADAYNKSIKKIKNYATTRPERFLVRMTELCLASLSLTLGNAKELPEWLYDPEKIKKILYAPALPQGNVLYANILLINKKYNELYGITKPMISMAAEMNYLLPQVYHLIYLSITGHLLGQTVRSQETLEKALAIALPDKVYLPFAEHGASLIPLFKSITIAAVDKKEIDAIIVLAKRLEKGKNEINIKLGSLKYLLTPREQEIALLARERLSAREIAEALFITESTVRSALKKIYSKLDVHSKAELSSIDF